MRRGIETVPNDGTTVILENDASAAYELGQWSAQERAWIGKNGKPIKIIPTHWHAMRRDADVVQEQCGLSGPPTSQAPAIFVPFSSGGPQWPSAAPEIIALPSVAKASPMDVIPIKSQDAQPAPRGRQAARQFALSSIATAMIALSLIGMYFRAEVSAYVTQYAGEHDHLAIGTIGAQFIKRTIQPLIPDSYKADVVVRDAPLPQQAPAVAGNAPATSEAVQITKTKAPEAIQPLENERRRADLAEKKLADYRRAMEGRNLELQGAALSLERDRGATPVQALVAAQQELTANEDKYRRALADERYRGAALASELATARRDVETQAALSSKTGVETVQLKQAAETATAELQLARDRAKALEGELAVARRDLETQVALSSKATDERAPVKQLKDAAESATAELRQSLQKERDRAEALASELATARTAIYAYEAQARKASDQAANLKETAESAALELRKPLQQERERAARLEQDLAAARRDNEKQIALASKADDEAAQEKKAAENATAELRQSLQKEHERSAALSSELARAQRDTETQLALSSKASDEAAQVKKAAESATAELRQSLQKERERADALSSELARAQRDTETQQALSSKAGDEAAQVKKAAESSTAELRQSLQKEHDRAEALSNELARAKRDSETQVALASKAGDEAAQLKQLKEAAESATAELRLSLQQERDRQALPPGRGPTQPTIGARTEVERPSNSQVAQVPQAAEAAATAQPAAAEVQGSPEAARLLTRASALIGQGDIGAARIVLERAVETGSARASFMLAETYDPLVLSTWKTYGTRGDVTKARELYAKALAGGIQEAKDRSVALH